MSSFYMDASGLLATLLKDDCGHAAAREFWSALVSTRSRLALSTTTIDAILPMLERDVLGCRTPYLAMDALLNSRIDRLEPDDSRRRRALQLMTDKVWPYRFSLDVAMAEKLQPDAVFSLDSRWDGTIFRRAEAACEPFWTRPFRG